MGPNALWRQSRRQTVFRSSSHCRATRSPLALLSVWRDRARTSPGYRAKGQSLPPNVSKSCARLYPAYADWRSWGMLTIPLACWTWPRFTRQRAPSASMLPSSKFGVPKILCPHLRRSRVAIPPDALINTQRIRINTLALGARLPTMYGAREYVEGGGFMSYGPSFSEQFRRAANYVDKILRGAKPGDIPIEQPTKFDLVINLTIAKALGLTIPESFLLRADEVIE